jgi:hypothetical protein
VIRSTIKPPLYRRIEIPPHGWGAFEIIHHFSVDGAVMVPSLVELDQHVSVASIVTNPSDETTACDFFAGKWFEIHGSPVLYVNGLGIRAFCGNEYRQ